MSQAQAMRLSLAALLGWVVAPALLAAGTGAYPTWRAAGGDGLLALLAAGLVVLTVIAASAAAVRWFAARGPAGAAQVFVLCSLARVVACVALSGAAWRAFGLPGSVLFIWTGVFYVVMLLGEATWLARALQRDALRVYLGEVRRASP